MKTLFALAIYYVLCPAVTLPMKSIVTSEFYIHMHNHCDGLSSQLMYKGLAMYIFIVTLCNSILFILNYMLNSKHHQQI